MFCALLSHQVSVYRTIGPLVLKMELQFAVNNEKSSWRSGYATRLGVVCSIPGFSSLSSDT